MKYWLPILLLLLACETASATVDPLTAPYVPSVDTNCAHAQYSTTSWMTDGGTKLRQDSGTNPGNSCYLSGSTQLYGTQNEFVDFQVHYRDAGSGTTGLKITIGNFVQSSPGSYTISSATGAASGSGGPYVNVYREWYTHVSVKTGVSTSFYNATGYYPDVLIPTVDPYWGQTTNAWPYTVAASNNQSAFIEVLIPQAALSGYYLASVLVQSGCPGSCTTVATMPVVLAVWQWPSAGYMPSKSTLTIVPQDGESYNMGCLQMYNPGTTTVSCGSYPGAGGNSDTANSFIFLDTSQILNDHRYGGGVFQNFFPEAGSFSNYTTYVGPVINSTCNLHLSAGSSCPILAGAAETTQQMSVLTPSASVWSNWQTNFNSNGWGTSGTPPLFNYLVDEPSGTSAFETAMTTANTQHGYLATAIPELVTTDIWFNQANQSAANTFQTTVCTGASLAANCILNGIDWLVSLNTVLEPPGGPIQTLSAYTNWVAGTNADGVPRRWFAYQDCTSTGTCSNNVTGDSSHSYTNYDIDGTPVANRAFEWMTYFHGQTGELYFQTSVCAINYNYTSCYPTGGSYTAANGPWSDTYYSGGWGDGTLLYFCSAGAGNSAAENYCGASVTTPLIYPSFRLKMMRDGVQDYEYMYKLNALGYGSTVSTQVSSEVTNSYTFGSWSTLISARLALGNFMHALSYPAGQSSPAPSRSGLMLAKSGR